MQGQEVGCVPRADIFPTPTFKKATEDKNQKELHRAAPGPQRREFLEDGNAVAIGVEGRNFPSAGVESHPLHGAGFLQRSELGASGCLPSFPCLHEV